MDDKDKYDAWINAHPGDDLRHTYIFSDLPANKAFYCKSIIQAMEAVLEQLESKEKPFSGASVAQVRAQFNRPFFDDAEEGMPLKESLDELHDLYFKDAIYFHKPKYVAHLNCPILIPALAAEVIISAINSSMDTWDQSAGGTFIELKLVEWTLRQLGYPVQGDGVFTSGGTQSNLMGLLLARDSYLRNTYHQDPKTEGLPAEASRFKVFCSEVSHFSLKKNASLLGLGQNSIVPVAVDSAYKMAPVALLEAIEEQRKMGNVPIAIVGTAGTTDFGSIDPLEELAAIAKQYNLWLHVDAAYGGGLLLSDQHSHKLKGIERSDSVTIDYHKTFFQPVSSSGFFMRDKKFVDYIKYHADYLNSKEQEEEGVPNMVKKSIQTTRRFDALKLWMTLRTIGRRRLGMYIDEVIELAQAAAALLRNDEEFEVLNQPQISAIVFRYKPFLSAEPLPVEQLSKLNLEIRKALFNQGEAIVASTKVGNEVYLKFTLLNPLTTSQDIQDIINLIKSHGKEYSSHHFLPAVSDSTYVQHVY